jgi:hypothetical protein
VLHINPIPPFRTESMGRPAVPPQGQYVLGPVSHFRHVTGALFQSRAARWTGTSLSPCRVIRPSSNRLSSSRPSASLASPPCRCQARFHGRHRMARAGLVSGRSAARRHVTVRAHRDAALAIGNPLFQPPTITAAGAWVGTGVSLAAQVLDSGPGVAAAAAIMGQSLAPSTRLPTSACGSCSYNSADWHTGAPCLKARPPSAPTSEVCLKVSVYETVM